MTISVPMQDHTFSAFVHVLQKIICIMRLMLILFCDRDHRHEDLPAVAVPGFAAHPRLAFLVRYAGASLFAPEDGVLQRPYQYQTTTYSCDEL